MAHNGIGDIKEEFYVAFVADCIGDERLAYNHDYGENIGIIYQQLESVKRMVSEDFKAYARACGNDIRIVKFKRAEIIEEIKL